MTLHTTPRTVDALVIGAGFSGLAILHHLREAGFETLVVDAADGIGGTWWVNNYPGVRTDSEFHYYSFTMDGYRRVLADHGLTLVDFHRDKGENSYFLATKTSERSTIHR